MQIAQYMLVFLEGLVSFFSPCIIPILPIYMGYMGNTKKEKSKLDVFINTIFFVFGISTAFIILGIAATSVGVFLNKYKNLISIISGIIIIIFALISLDVIKVNILNKEKRIKVNTKNKKSNIFLAYVLGFTFSFAWTPCIGPMLSSVLLMMASKATVVESMILLGLYTLGFTIPFMLLGIFTNFFLDLVKKKQNIFRYLMVCINIMLIVFGGYLIISSTSVSNTNIEFGDGVYSFNLQDVNGNMHSLEEYRGKTIFINFFATWCGPCNYEMPFIQEVYEEKGLNKKDVAIITIACPDIIDISSEGIKEFTEKSNYTFPVLLDVGGKIFNEYNINSYPTTYVIDKKGNLKYKHSGALSKNEIINLIKE